MKIIRSIDKMRRQTSFHRRKGQTIGFVPTMGYLHEGHFSLIRQARKDTDIVVVSVFVNSVQFGKGEDYKEYPRDLAADSVLCKKEGVDYLFYPSSKDMYPVKYATFVFVEGLTSGLCGKFRPGHFRGVATVVTKLFNIVRPDIAYFGRKDAQQAIVIRRMAEDLNMGVRVKVMPIIREDDGLAMSSRNVHLSSDERKKALALYQALQLAGNLIKSGGKDAGKIIREMRKVISPVAAKIDYMAIVDSRTLEDVKTIKGEVMAAVAVWIGGTRLIDNIIIRS